MHQRIWDYVKILFAQSQLKFLWSTDIDKLIISGYG